MDGRSPKPTKFNKIGFLTSAFGASESSTSFIKRLDEQVNGFFRASSLGYPVNHQNPFLFVWDDLKLILLYYVVYPQNIQKRGFSVPPNHDGFWMVFALARPVPCAVLSSGHLPCQMLRQPIPKPPSRESERKSAIALSKEMSS